jgi:hypothetical protein
MIADMRRDIAVLLLKRGQEFIACYRFRQLRKWHVFATITD